MPAKACEWKKRELACDSWSARLSFQQMLLQVKTWKANNCEPASFQQLLAYVLKGNSKEEICAVGLSPRTAASWKVNTRRAQGQEAR